MKKSRALISALVLLLTFGGTLFAETALSQRQPQHVFLPEASLAASVGQRVGLTEIEISYHRPAVGGREIWGALVPYGQVWRTGADENTLISFSTDVEIEGRSLAAGTYGLHTLPGESGWEIIFSRDTAGWGSFSYDQELDALRVSVKPAEAPFEERMSFAFEEAGNESVEVALRWEKLRVAFEVAVSQETTLAGIREQLRGLSQFFWQGWDQAATYCLQQGINYEEALKWSDQSIQIKETFQNLATKSRLLGKTGEEAQSAELMRKAITLGNAGELHGYARQLLTAGEKEAALAVFKSNVEQNSDVWFVDLGLARGYSGVGDFANAVRSMKKALERAPEPRKEYVKGLIQLLEKERDIN